ncbi:MAG: hypothetical protein LJF04_09335, partial [Gemmatimonadetes bacterium]|nr:hypothetical protein [Gemmatimonadota bacterium]
SGLRVVSRTSVMRYLGATTPVPTIGKELQVDAVIEGSVRRDSTHVRITVQLIHAASDTHIWTKQYDRDLKDVLSLESEVAQEIAKEVRAEVTPEERRRLTRTASTSVDPRVQEAYLRGRYEYDRGDYSSAIQHFQGALSQDSTFAPAMAWLAGSRFLLGLSDPSAAEADPDLAQKEAQQAVAMDSLSSEAREVDALIQANLPAVKSALASRAAPGIIAKAPPTVVAPGVDSIPGLPVLDTAWVVAMTQLGRRIEEQVRSQSADAERQGRMSQVLAARQLTVSGNFKEAVDVLHGLVTSNPDFDPGWELLARAQLASGDVDSTVTTLDKWRAAGGEGAPTTEEIEALHAAVKENGVKGYWSWALQRMERKKAQGQHVSRAELAAAYTALGRTEDAFAVLQDGVQQGDRGLLMLDADPVFDPLRSDPRFADILSEVRTIRFSGWRRPPGASGGRLQGGPGREGGRR